MSLMILQWKRSESLLRTASPYGDAMLLDGKAPRAGQVMRFPQLAETFKLLVRDGRDGFYKGRIAQAIVDLIRDGGGVMTLEDLAEHESTPVDPISYTYKNDVTVYEVGECTSLVIVANLVPQCPPNGQGITALMALGILDVLESDGVIPPLVSMQHNSAEYLHVLVESLR